MTKKALNFISKLEGYLTSIKELHWNSSNLSQHELCDKIADRIAEFQDQVSEVEQSISGNLPFNKLKGINYEVKDLKSFVNDVIDDTNEFYKTINGEKYIGMRSDCESFLSDMQRNLYLVNFTLKEELKKSLRKKITEGSRSSSIADMIMVPKGRKPMSLKSRINKIYKVVNDVYKLGGKVWHDDHWQGLKDYYEVITSLGCDMEAKPCADLHNSDSIGSDGGYTDYGEDHMPRSKQYAVKITFEDGMAIEGYIKFMAAGTIQDPFSKYDSCMILWPKNEKKLRNKRGSKIIGVTESQASRIFRDDSILV